MAAAGEEAPLQADVSFENTAAHATFLPARGLLTWQGQRKSGALDFGKALIGFRVGASTIMLHTLQHVQGGCCKKAAIRKVDLLMDFHDAHVHSEWQAAFQKWLDAAGRPKKLLVLLNPHGGRGQAVTIFHNVAKPLFQAANITLDVQETQYYKHAEEIAKQLQLGSHDGVVCVSGDGLPVEVLNGFLQRPDWQQAIKMPLGVIPAGSGNGMAKSLLDLAGLECNVMNATFAVITGRTTRVDVATVRQGPSQYHSFLNITWGIVSDVDIESEKYRWMGGLRFTFQAIVRILRLRQYQGRISYLPANNGVDKRTDSAFSRGQEEANGFYQGPAVSTENRETWQNMEGQFTLVWLQNVQYAATDMKTAPHAQLADGCLDMLVIRRGKPGTLLNLFLQIDSGKHIQSKAVEYLKIRALRMEVGGRIGSKISGGYVVVDGEVVARGSGSIGNAKTDVMNYSEPFEVGVEQGLATFFCPQ